MRTENIKVCNLLEIEGLSYSSEMFLPVILKVMTTLSIICLIKAKVF